MYSSPFYRHFYTTVPRYPRSSAAIIWRSSSILYRCQWWWRSCPSLTPSVWSPWPSSSLSPTKSLTRGPPSSPNPPGSITWPSCDFTSHDHMSQGGDFWLVTGRNMTRFDWSDLRSGTVCCCSLFFLFFFITACTSTESLLGLFFFMVYYFFSEKFLNFFSCKEVTDLIHGIMKYEICNIYLHVCLSRY